MSDPFQNFNETAERTMGYPLIRRAELRLLFQEMERLIQRGVRLLVKPTSFVEDNLCFQLAEIAGSAIQGRKLYKGKLVKSRRGVGAGVAVGTKNAKILGRGADLFKLSRVSREAAVPLTLKIIRSLQLSNLVYEQILMAFAEETAQYPPIIERLVVEHGRLYTLRQGATEDEIVAQMQLISELIDEKERAENAVSCIDNTVLYGVAIQVRRIVKQLRSIKERIVTAYLRLVPGLVKECGAQSDIDALDLFQAGSMGLYHATSVYDYHARTGFQTIAKRWIKQRIMAARKKSSGPIIRIAYSVYEDYGKILRARRALRRESPARAVTNEMVAARLGITEERIDKVMEKVALTQVASLSVVVDVPGEDEAVEREATIVDNSHDDYLYLVEKQERLLSLLHRLDDTARRTICLRFGFADGIDNSQIDARERLRELLVQIACKTLVNQRLAAR